MMGMQYVCQLCRNGLVFGELNLLGNVLITFR